MGLLCWCLDGPFWGRGKRAPAVAGNVPPSNETTPADCERGEAKDGEGTNAYVVRLFIVGSRNALLTMYHIGSTTPRGPCVLGVRDGLRTIEPSPSISDRGEWSPIRSQGTTKQRYQHLAYGCGCNSGSDLCLLSRRG